MKGISECISKLLIRKSGKRRLNQPHLVLPCRRFSRAEINIATKNFDDSLLIERRASGNEYKGCIDDATNTVSVTIKRVNIRSMEMKESGSLCTSSWSMEPSRDTSMPQTPTRSRGIEDYRFALGLRVGCTAFVILLELLCGRKPGEGEEQMNLVEWARKCKREGNINEIIDPYLMGKIAPECFMEYVDIATSCVRNRGERRPTMGEVQVCLEHALELQDRADAATAAAGDCNYCVDEYTCNASSGDASPN
nr:receptor-like protein kinase feronia [Quercus suber]